MRRSRHRAPGGEIKKTMGAHLHGLAWSKERNVSCKWFVRKSDLAVCRQIESFHENLGADNIHITVTILIIKCPFNVKNLDMFSVFPQRNERCVFYTSGIFTHIRTAKTHWVCVNVWIRYPPKRSHQLASKPRRLKLLGPIRTQGKNSTRW